MWITYSCYLSTHILSMPCVFDLNISPKARFNTDYLALFLYHIHNWSSSPRHEASRTWCHQCSCDLNATIQQMKILLTMARINDNPWSPENFHSFKESRLRVVLYTAFVQWILISQLSDRQTSSQIILYIHQFRVPSKGEGPMIASILLAHHNAQCWSLMKRPSRWHLLMDVQRRCHDGSCACCWSLILQNLFGREFHIIQVLSSVWSAMVTSWVRCKLGQLLGWCYSVAKFKRLGNNSSWIGY